jgi:pyruvate/2-oxoglutarate dehydrogenase complex dihydrolipoamide dehydrogenase (E3) component
MAAERSYDAIVIGAGQRGKPLSMVLARAGLKTAVVEEKCGRNLRQLRLNAD